MGAPFGGADAGACWPPAPRLWPGETVCIAGSGPSLTQAQVDAVKGKARLIVINSTWELAPWADMLYACDPQWWGHHHGAPGFRGLKVSQSASAASQWPDVKRIPGTRGTGLSLDPEIIHFGRNSGYQALNLAVHLGAKRILLIGYDMRVADGAVHWHGPHDPALNNPHNDLFKDCVKLFRTTIPDLKTAGVEVINCTPGSALDAFPRMTLEDALGTEPGMVGKGGVATRARGSRLQGAVG